MGAVGYVPLHSRVQIRQLFQFFATMSGESQQCLKSTLTCVVPSRHQPEKHICYSSSCYLVIIHTRTSINYQKHLCFYQSPLLQGRFPRYANVIRKEADIFNTNFTFSIILQSYYLCCVFCIFYFFCVFNYFICC
jgi:hypothetical protein